MTKVRRYLGPCGVRVVHGSYDGPCGRAGTHWAIGPDGEPIPICDICLAKANASEVSA